MAGAGGLAEVLLGGLIGFIFSIVAIVLVIHGLRTRNPRRAFITSIIALVLSVVAVLLSETFWTVLLSGQSTHGEPLDYSDEGPLLVLIALEALALLASIANAARQALRRLS